MTLSRPAGIRALRRKRSATLKAIRAKKKEQDKAFSQWRILTTRGAEDKIRRLQGEVSELERNLVAIEQAIKCVHMSTNHDLKDRLFNRINELQSTQSKLARKRRELSIAQRLLASKEPDMVADATIQKFLRLKHVLAIEIEDEFLVLYTDVIRMLYANELLELGIYKIKIQLINGFDRSIEALYTTHPKGVVHPNGAFVHICGIRNEVETAHYDGDIYRVAEYMFAWLLSLIVNWTSRYKTNGGAHPQAWVRVRKLRRKG